jgi:selenophosphate synthetase-related protein
MSTVLRSGPGCARQVDAVLREGQLQTAASRLAVATLGGHIDEDRPGCLEAIGDEIGHLARQDALRLPCGRIDGGDEKDANVVDRHAG